MVDNLLMTDVLEIRPWEVDTLALSRLVLCELDLAVFRMCEGEGLELEISTEVEVCLLAEVTLDDGTGIVDTLGVNRLVLGDFALMTE